MGVGSGSGCVGVSGCGCVVGLEGEGLIFILISSLLIKKGV